MIPPPPRSTLFPYTTLFRSMRAQATPASARTVLSPVRSRRSSAPCESTDRKSTRLNSSHANISYAVFCLKKKKKKYRYDERREYHTKIKTNTLTAYASSNDG